MNITREEIVEAIRTAMEAAPQPDGTVTTGELMISMDTSETITRRNLRALIIDGTMEAVKSPRWSHLTNTYRMTPAFRIKQ